MYAIRSYYAFPCGPSPCIDSGVSLDARLTPELINTIFWPGSALHDMGVVIRSGRIAAAGESVITSYSIHYTKLYEKLMDPGTGKPLPEQNGDAGALFKKKGRGPLPLEKGLPAAENAEPDEQQRHQQKGSAGRTHRSAFLILDQLVLQGVDERLIRSVT